MHPSSSSLLLSSLKLSDTMSMSFKYEPASEPTNAQPSGLSLVPTPRLLGGISGTAFFETQQHCIGCRTASYIAKRLPGGLVFKAHRWLYHSILGSRVIKRKQNAWIRSMPTCGPPFVRFRFDRRSGEKGATEGSVSDSVFG